MSLGNLSPIISFRFEFKPFPLWCRPRMRIAPDAKRRKASDSYFKPHFREHGYSICIMTAQRFNVADLENNPLLAADNGLHGQAGQAPWDRSTAVLSQKSTLKNHSPKLPNWCFFWTRLRQTNLFPVRADLLNTTEL